MEKMIGFTNWPTPLLRLAIRGMLSKRLNEEAERDANGAGKLAFIQELKDSPIALSVNEANEQHYEVPATFYERVLGPHLKYSSGHWSENANTLETSELEMLMITSERAQLKDGQTVLDLGCGWGSMSLHVARSYPNSRVLGVSNSRTQRAYILEKAKREGLTNIDIMTADANDLTLDRRFDRVVSIEMFEHLRNYEIFFERIASWLAPDGKLFVHVFGHRQYAYPFESEARGGWMARNFFTNGIMPSADLLLHFQNHLALADRWAVNGTHYHRTCEAWLDQHETQRAEIETSFAEVYGADQAFYRWMSWKIFFLACSELFAYRRGNEWMVYHYLFEKRQASAAQVCDESLAEPALSD